MVAEDATGALGRVRPASVEAAEALPAPERPPRLLPKGCMKNVRFSELLVGSSWRKGIRYLFRNQAWMPARGPTPPWVVTSGCRNPVTGTNSRPSAVVRGRVFFSV